MAGSSSAQAMARLLNSAARSTRFAVQSRSKRNGGKQRRKRRRPHGDGVNIAARLEGIATPGRNLPFRAAYRYVKGRLDLKVTEMLRPIAMITLISAMPFEWLSACVSS
jgi:class 3 adenylate cyclase